MKREYRIVKQDHRLNAYPWDYWYVLEKRFVFCWYKPITWFRWWLYEQGNSRLKEIEAFRDNMLSAKPDEVIWSSKYATDK